MGIRRTGQKWQAGFRVSRLQDRPEVAKRTRKRVRKVLNHFSGCSGSFFSCCITMPIPIAIAVIIPMYTCATRGRGGGETRRRFQGACYVCTHITTNSVMYRHEFCDVQASQNSQNLFHTVHVFFCDHGHRICSGHRIAWSQNLFHTCACPKSVRLRTLVTTLSPIP